MDCWRRLPAAASVSWRVFACFGGFSARRSTLAEEISENVRLALKNDARTRTATLDTAAQAGVQITFPLRPA